MSEIRAVDPKDIRNWWGYVKPGLETILRKSPEEWIPEDIYAACLNGGAILWVLMTEDRPQGFWVIIPRGESVHVWCAWTDENVLDLGMELFLNTVKSSNTRFVTFESRRKGWDRVARKYGFIPRMWIKELI